MDTTIIKLVIIVAAIIAAIYLFLMYARRLKLTHNTVLAFTGGLGSGKTYMAVTTAIKEYRRQAARYKWQKRFNCKNQDAPTLYSNIPIRIDRDNWSIQLTREHLLLQDRLPEKAIVLIDELGQVADQYSYNNPNVRLHLQELIRFYRHYTDGKLIVTDQSSANIEVDIRRRINLIYCLNDFRRVFGFLPFYKIDVSPLEVTEESVTNVNQLQQTEDGILSHVSLEKPYFFGYLPYKWQKNKRHYDSRCFSEKYVTPFKKGFNRYERYKTDYIIDITPTPEELPEKAKKR